MKNFLKIVLGSNFFSLSELAHLKKGDIVLVTAICGKPQELYWNNQLVAFGELVVIDDLFGFRVTSFGVGKQEEKFLGVKEQLIDIMKADIIISEKEVQTEELLKIKEGTIIVFGKSINELFDLNISDEKIATGKVCVVDENFALEITEVQNFSDFEIEKYPYKSTGNVFNACSIEVKYYDFTRPDKFTMKQIYNMVKIHNRFINNVIFNSNENIKAEVKSVDQLAFYEFFDILKEKKVDILKFSTDNKTTKCLSYIQLHSSNNKLSENLVRELNKLLTQNKKLNGMPLLLVYDEISPFVQKNTFEISFKKAWESLKHVETDILKREVSFNESSKIIPDKDMICVVEISFEDEKNKGKITIVYPYITIEDMLPKLEFSIF